MWTTTDEDELIIEMVKDSQCLYDKQHKNYYKNNEKNRLYEQMAQFLNIKFNSTLTASDVKKRWECLRKSYGSALRKDRQQYVYFEKMSFLKDFIHAQELPKDSQNSDMPSSSFNVDRREKLNPFQNLPAVGIASKNIPPEKCNVSNESAVNCPASDTFAKKKEHELDLLEKQIIDVAKCTMKSITREQSKDCFVIAIKESLRLVPEDNLLLCLPGIFDILIEYQKKKN